MENDAHGTKAARFWDEQAQTDNFSNRIWLAHPLIQKRMQKLVTGDEDCSIWGWLIEHIKSLGTPFPLDTILSVGCGQGELERLLSNLECARRIIGFDISAKSVASARQHAVDGNFHNIEYVNNDLNIDSLSDFKSDLIIGNMAVHHIENLELFFEGCIGSLNKNGWLFLHEYIGPQRFQWSVNQLKLINRLLKSLPAEMRQLPNGVDRPAIYMPLQREMIAADPSESVRSNEIIPVMNHYFDIVTYRSMRGALLHYLLSEIIMNFMKTDLHAGYVSVLAEVEDILFECGTIEDNFAVVLAKPKY